MRGASGRLLIIIGYVLLICSILATAFSLLIGVSLFVASVFLIDNVQLRAATPTQRVSSILKTIKDLLIAAALVLFGMQLENHYHLYANDSTMTYFLTVFIAFVLLSLLTPKDEHKANKA